MSTTSEDIKMQTSESRIERIARLRGELGICVAALDMIKNDPQSDKQVAACWYLRIRKELAEKQIADFVEEGYAKAQETLRKHGVDMPKPAVVTQDVQKQAAKGLSILREFCYGPQKCTKCQELSRVNAHVQCFNCEYNIALTKHAKGEVVVTNPLRVGVY